MADRENVIKALELCTSKIETRTQVPCEACSYHNTKYHGVLGDGCCNIRSLHRDCLALLKAQEPNEDWISRKRLKDEIQYYIDEAGWGDEVNKVLGWCMEFIDNQRAVKWE